MEWILNHWVEIMLAILIADKIVAATPTKYDDIILTAIKSALSSLKPKNMKILIFALLFPLMLAFPCHAKTAFVGATALTGGGTGALDAIECEDILGDDSDRAIATGDICFVITSGKDLYIYRYDSTGTDSEADNGPNDPIVPDDRADCSSTGQWDLIDSIQIARSATPQTIWRDSDCTDNDDNAYFTINCTNTGSGTEVCDITLYVQIAGAATAVLTVDADGAITSSLPFIAGNSIEITNGTDPDVDAEGEISHDTDGANIANDETQRGYDGTNQFAWSRKLKCIHVSCISPNDYDDATRDKLIIWENQTGMTFTIVGWSAQSDTDDTTLNIEEYDGDGQNNSTVDAVEIATDGTSLYYASDSTITAGTIETGHLLALDFDDTDDPGLVTINIWGWFNSDVD